MLGPRSHRTTNARRHLRKGIEGAIKSLRKSGFAVDCNAFCGPRDVDRWMLQMRRNEKGQGLLLYLKVDTIEGSLDGQCERRSFQMKFFQARNPVKCIAWRRIGLHVVAEWA